MKVYVVLTKSLTPISMLINLVTHDQYTHASISFEESLQPMYSIGRRFTFLPAPAHFKQEPFNRGFYWWHRNCKVGVYALEVSAQAMARMKAYVESCQNAEKKIQFSYIGLANAGIGREKEYDNKMFCSEFVANVLKKSGEIDTVKDPSIYHPVDFLAIAGIQCEFKGKMRDLCHRVYGQYNRWSF